jgi:hypothetical protein
MTKRKGIKQTVSLKDRLALFATKVRETAELLPAGRERDALLKKAREADSGAQPEDRADSRGLKPPK